MTSSGEIQINGHRVSVLSPNVTPAMFVKTLANSRSSQQKHNAFYVANLSDIITKYREQWTALLPRVRPYYAVKSNDNQVVLSVMARLGAGFDCASKNEIKSVLQALNAEIRTDSSVADRIIFANTCKKLSHIRFAAEAGVNLMTFDSESELFKVKESHPTAKMVIRLKAKNGLDAAFHERFGCSEEYAICLLRLAKQLGIDVVGVSFHVGGVWLNPTTYVDLIESCRVVFDAAETIGFKFHLLDIGGGISGNRKPKVPFAEVASVIRGALDRFFPDQPGLKIIAEPGQFFVASAFTLANNVLGVKCIADGDAVLEEDSTGKGIVYHYTLVEGSFGTMMAYAESFPRPAPIVPTVLDEEFRGQLFQSVLWGPTPAGFDCITHSCLLPKRNVGDWIFFEEMGAYSQNLATDFLQKSQTKVFYAIDQQDREGFSD